MKGKKSNSEKEEEPPAAAAAPPANESDDSEDSSSEEEEDDLVLEGVLVRNPDVSDSDDSSDDDDDDDEEEETKPPPAKKSKSEPAASNKKDKTKAKQAKKKKPKKKREPGPDILQVDFTFCDMNEKFFHGLKTLLTATSPLHAKHSSDLSDLMIKNISVGTVTSTEGDQEGTVYGFASVLNVTTYQDEACFKDIKKQLLSHCPEANKKELEVVLSGKTKRPAGFYLHGRMVNMPLEIVQVLHEQLVLDMDWAVENAEGGEEERKSLNFGAFVLLAPTYRVSGTSYFKMFDDEIFASHAEFTYEIELPKSYGMEETPYVTVVVMTKTGHRDAMKSLVEMVGGGGAPAR
eukprot:Nitzschia sp. Nitz4//scaffold91_size79674//21880//22923//NITZ4_005358-RA/size79674-processed-gene-0.103-mRNA-1//-1//CDS//3329560073//3094//frame0